MCCGTWILARFLHQAVIVSLWKKRGDRSDLDDHRGICLIPVFSRLLVKVIASRLSDFCEREQVFDWHSSTPGGSGQRPRKRQEPKRDDKLLLKIKTTEEFWSQAKRTRMSCATKLVWASSIEVLDLCGRLRKARSCGVQSLQNSSPEVQPDETCSRPQSSHLSCTVVKSWCTVQNKFRCCRVSSTEWSEASL